MSKQGEPLSVDEKVRMKIDPIFARKQAKANCKLLYGPNIDIVTFNLGNNGQNVVAIKAAAISTNSDGSWTEHLAMDGVWSGVSAVQRLLCKSEELLREKHDANADTDKSKELLREKHDTNADTEAAIVAWDLR